METLKDLLNEFESVVSEKVVINNIDLSTKVLSKEDAAEIISKRIKIENKIKELKEKILLLFEG